MTPTQIKKLRKALGMSTYEFGRELDVSHTTVSNLEHGQRNATTYLADLNRLVRRLEIIRTAIAETATSR